MKIIILGCGKIGISHLMSFINAKSKYSITIVDKLTRLQILEKELSKYKNVIFKSKIPRKEKFDLVIIATNSLERFSVFKKFVDHNKVKKIIFEKFVFAKVNDFLLFNKYYKTFKSRILVNTFGKYIYYKCFKNLHSKEKIIMDVKVPRGKLFTLMIHYVELFCLLSRGIKIIDFSNITSLIKSKRKNYYEGLGKIYFYSSKSKLKIFTSNKCKNSQIKIKIGKNAYKIILKKYHYYFFNNDVLIKKFIFPLAAKFTEKNLFKNFNKYKNFEDIFKNSYIILKELRNSFNKSIYIT